MNYKILYVEDENDIRKNICLFIKNNFNVTVFEASNGKKGLACYLQHKPDLLITDLNMGESGGFDLLEKIREVDPDIKIIILSAHSEKEKLLRAMRLNLIEYLIKPVSRKQLKIIINKSLEILKSQKKNKLFYFNKNSYYNLETKSLFVNNKNIKITNTEIKLLILFINQSNQIINTIDIFNHIWDFEKEYKIESVRTLVKKVRKKLPDDIIVNVYGGGYKLVST